MIELLTKFNNQELSRSELMVALSELMVALSLHSRGNFTEGYLKPALLNGLVEMTLADKPNSSKQKYRLTQLGKDLLASKLPLEEDV